MQDMFDAHIALMTTDALFNLFYISAFGYEYNELWFQIISLNTYSPTNHGRVACILVWIVAGTFFPYSSSFMMTSSNWDIFRVTGHLCGNSPVPGEFPTQRPVTRSFDVSFVLPLNKRLSKQLWGWWLETRSRPLWCHRNVLHTYWDISRIR